LRDGGGEVVEIAALVGWRSEGAVGGVRLEGGVVDVEFDAAFEEVEGDIVAVLDEADGAAKCGF
jgi:hypothetical protein